MNKSRSPKHFETKPQKWEKKPLVSFCFLLFISSFCQNKKQKQTNNNNKKTTQHHGGGWLLCRQRTKIPLRLEINTYSDNRNLRQAWIVIIIMCKFHCLHICSYVFADSFSTISQHVLALNRDISLAWRSTEKKVSNCLTWRTSTQTCSDHQLVGEIWGCTLTQIIV